jgi:putative SOS response-associated peptidase YedK
MCFFTQQQANFEEIETRFCAKMDNPARLIKSDFVNGFSYPNLPIIIDSTPSTITTDFNWGVIPNWSKDLEIRNKTLNARIETIHEKPSFNNIIHNRCLIIATAYYEWHWNDAKGKSKDKYQINSQENEIFTFAGLYNFGTNPENGEVLNTFTMVTTQANKVMKYVHNHKKRMPIMLNKEDENAWLDNSNLISEFAYPYEGNLVAFKTI